MIFTFKHLYGLPHPLVKELNLYVLCLKCGIGRREEYKVLRIYVALKPLRPWEMFALLND